MPRYFDCGEYSQSDEKGPSLSERNACRKCGRTREAHAPRITADEEATLWLTAHGMRHALYFDLVRGILARFILEQRG